MDPCIRSDKIGKKERSGTDAVQLEMVFLFQLKKRINSICVFL